MECAVHNERVQYHYDSDRILPLINVIDAKVIALVFQSISHRLIILIDNCSEYPASKEIHVNTGYARGYVNNLDAIKDYCDIQREFTRFVLHFTLIQMLIKE